MHLKSLVVFVFLVALTFCQTQAYNYCTEKQQKRLCKKEKHFYCNPEQVESGGKLITIYPNTNKLIEAYLNEHNKRRQNVSSGKEFCGKDPSDKCTFPKAARMRELIWDDELAFLAEVHAARCRTSHDKCHNTERFPYSGQNLWSSSSSAPPNLKALEYIEKSVGAWYSEKERLTDSSLLSDFSNMPSGTETTGHLTVMINDRVSRVGCALAYCQDDKGKTVWHKHFITCNYDYTNMAGEPVYTADTESGTKCSDWGVARSENYKDLCANSGEIFTIRNENDDESQPQPEKPYYCRKEVHKKLCDTNRHIVCYPEQLPPEAKLMKVYPNTSEVIQKYLDEHNKYRQKIASGTEFCGAPKDKCNFPKAARMRELIWDVELEFLAKFHAALCHFGHDECRNTERFPFSGQNLGWYKLSPTPGNPTAPPAITHFKIIETIMANFYKEKDLFTDSSLLLDKMPYDKTGHLTVIINDRVSRVGCAMAYCRREKGGKIEAHEFYTTCNYEYTNMAGEPVYTFGAESGSQCGDWGVGKSKKYEDLCANSGKIFTDD